MGRLGVLNVLLFILPVIITVAVVVGIEEYRRVHGHGSTDHGGSGDSSNNSTAPVNKTVTDTYCQKELGILPAPGRYIYNPNQWGAMEADAAGSLCMNITSNAATPNTSLTAPAFTATWQFPVGPEDEPVHAFPNAALVLPSVLPVQMTDISDVSIDVTWTYGAGSEIATTTDAVGVEAAGMQANVCVDMFLDPDASKAGNTNSSAYEVMVWLGRYGVTAPIGLSKGSQRVENVNGTLFDLYTGGNALQQGVFTWVARGNTTDFTANFMSLLNLTEFDGPGSSDYLGYISFGSETLSATSNVTFSVPDLWMDIVKG